MLKRVSKPRNHFDGENFMTPTAVAYYKLRKGLGYAELSRGEGFTHEPIFGVTVASDGNINHDLSRMFHSIGAATGYITDLS